MCQFCKPCRICGQVKRSATVSLERTCDDCAKRDTPELRLAARLGQMLVWAGHAVTRAFEPIIEQPSMKNDFEPHVVRGFGEVSKEEAEAALSSYTILGPVAWVDSYKTKICAVCGRQIQRGQPYLKEQLGMGWHQYERLCVTCGNHRMLVLERLINIHGELDRHKHRDVLLGVID